MLSCPLEIGSQKRPSPRCGPQFDCSPTEPSFKKLRTKDPEYADYGPPHLGGEQSSFKQSQRPRYGPCVALPLEKANSTTEPIKLNRYGPIPEASYCGNEDAFKAFEWKARIQDFDAALLPKVSKKESYNDDIKLEHFQSSARHHAGKQRKGVVDEHMECLSMLDHVDTALFSPFFLSLSVPIPASIREAALFIRDAPPNMIVQFWDAQLSALDKLVLDPEEIEAARNSKIPTEIAPSSGKVKLAALMSLALQCGVGGSVWLQQFLFGFPLVGRLAQPQCFPVKQKEACKKPEPISKLFNSNRTRFADRASKSGFKNASALWAEALQQCEKGWLTQPFPLCDSKDSFVLQNPKLNIAFRFGVEQGAKLRACDDLRHSRTNLSCVVETPIKLVSWDHLAELTNLVNDGSRDWGFFKADHEAAYKQLPLDYSHANLAVIALRSPTNGLWYGFLSRTLMFGAIAAALRYNVFPRLLSPKLFQSF